MTTAQSGFVMKLSMEVKIYIYRKRIAIHWLNTSLGRTGPLKLFAQADDEYQLGYKDFNSLYPDRTFHTEYPIGHPEPVEVHNKAVNWSSSNDNPYKGIIKCFVIPPPNLRIPVLPLKLPGKLAFPLCRTCATTYSKKGLKAAEYKCHHNDDQRGWVAALTHLELNAALDRGYKVVQLYRTLTWKKWSNELFRSFVRQFIRLKVHASGWPPHIKTDEEKAKFIEEYAAHGFEIDPDQMVPNPGLRYLAKICLNR